MFKDKIKKFTHFNNYLNKTKTLSLLNLSDYKLLKGKYEKSVEAIIIAGITFGTLSSLLYTYILFTLNNMYLTSTSLLLSFLFFLFFHYEEHKKQKTLKILR